MKPLSSPHSLFTNLQCLENSLPKAGFPFNLLVCIVEDAEDKGDGLAKYQKQIRSEVWDWNITLSTTFFLKVSYSKSGVFKGILRKPAIFYLSSSPTDGDLKKKMRRVYSLLYCISSLKKQQKQQINFQKTTEINFIKRHWPFYSLSTVCLSVENDSDMIGIRCLCLQMMTDVSW